MPLTLPIYIVLTLYVSLAQKQTNTLHMHTSDAQYLIISPSLSLWHLPLQPLLLLPESFSRIQVLDVYHHQLCSQLCSRVLDPIGLAWVISIVVLLVVFPHPTGGSSTDCLLRLSVKARPDCIISYSFSCSNSFESPLLSAHQHGI